MHWTSPYLFMFFNLIPSADREIVDYYVNLINRETARASTIVLPRDAYEYAPPFRAHCTYFGTFDYIVVGAGSAGCVIASRLSEDANNQVLLIEAGGDENEFTEIPAYSIFLQASEYNWNYNTTPQRKACLGMTNRECNYPRGKGLGGSSIINALTYIRGNRKDYDNWYNQGNPGWSFEDVLPFFKLVEHTETDGDPRYHGYNGPVNIAYHEPLSPLFEAFIDANAAIGTLGRNVRDLNEPDQLGGVRFHHNVRNGRRVSSNKAYLRPARGRSNLRVLTHSLVTKILINPQTKVAYGVVFSNQNGLFIAEARKEVILSAGAIGSPQLLLLSGIGPRYHLESVGIPVIQELAVGDNLQDHATYFSLQFVSDYVEENVTLDRQVIEYLRGTGPLTISVNAQGGGFYQVTDFLQEDNYPDIELSMNPAPQQRGFIQKVFHYNDDVINTIWANIDEYRAFTISLSLLHPKARGTVRLRSNNPYEYPLIDPMYYCDGNGQDIETMYRGIQFVLNLIDAAPFRKLNAQLYYAPLPACSQYEYLSKPYWYCQLMQLTSTIYHPIGTCKMGPNPFTGAVVNNKLQVYGIRNLRVADCSIMPTTVSGHTNAAAMMIGEKVSHMIRTENSGFRF